MSQKTTDLKVQSKKIGPLSWAFSAKKRRSVRRSLWRWFWLRVLILTGLIVLIRLRQQASEQEEGVEYPIMRREPAFQPPATQAQSPSPSSMYESVMRTGPAISYRTPEPPQVTGSSGTRMEPSQTAPVETAGDAEDDLKAIEGIGPRIASLFQDAGIRTYRQLAQTDPSRMEEILRSAEIRGADVGTWAEQARLAANGDWDGLREMQSQLKGGRRAEEP